jgi:ABC-type oligopeptide transport system substrate-binding subunit
MAVLAVAAAFLAACGSSAKSATTPTSSTAPSPSTRSASTTNPTTSSTGSGTTATYQPRNTFSAGAPIGLGDWQILAKRPAAPANGNYVVQVEVTNLGARSEKVPAGLFTLRDGATSKDVAPTTVTDLDRAIKPAETRTATLTFRVPPPAHPYLLVKGQLLGQYGLAIQLAGPIQSVD